MQVVAIIDYVVPQCVNMITQRMYAIMLNADLDLCYESDTSVFSTWTLLIGWKNKSGSIVTRT
jgi:hypothetical protein